jgi:hypothetical protein
MAWRLANALFRARYVKLAELQHAGEITERDSFLSTGLDFADDVEDQI